MGDFDIAGFVGTIGLPGALCWYVLAKLNKTVEANTRVMLLLAGKMGVNPNDTE